MEIIYILKIHPICFSRNVFGHKWKGFNPFCDAHLKDSALALDEVLAGRLQKLDET